MASDEGAPLHRCGCAAHLLRCGDVVPSVGSVRDVVHLRNAHTRFGRTRSAVDVYIDSVCISRHASFVRACVHVCGFAWVCICVRA